MAEDSLVTQFGNAPGAQYKVRLVSSVDPNMRVVFNVTPALSESRSVEYTPVTPVHMPGTIQVYKNTNSRTFSITAHLISRNSADASLNALYLQTLRAWTMPYFGKNSATNPNTIKERRNASGNQSQILRRTQQPDADYSGRQDGPTAISNEQQAERVVEQIKSTTYELLGAPPEILYLSAYSSPRLANRNEFGTLVFNLNKIPTVITNLGISYPEDVDYIPTYHNNEPFPIKMDVTIDLAETHSPREYEMFSLQKYKLGQLTNF